MTKKAKAKTKTKKPKSKRRRGGTPKKPKNTVVGTIQKTTRPFAFLIPDDKSDDVFIPGKKMGDAMNGDKVAVAVESELRKQGSREGEVVKVLERNYEEVVGTYEKNKNYGFVIPDDKKMNEDVFIHKRDSSDAKSGEKVVCKITKYPSKNNSAEGKIIEVLGDSSSNSVALKSLIRSHGIKETFPRKVLNEAKFIPEEITDIKDRRDLRGEKIFTIDGADSKDFDDAVSIKRLENGNYLLGVHIADVTAYVKEDSYLDKEAYRRGTSVYLLDTVVPMLPFELSNGICSLKEGVDRFTLSVDMEINAAGVVIRHDIYESVINSTARLIYNDVSDLLENNAPFERDDIKDDLFLMDELARILRKKREERGSIDFDLEESVIQLDNEGIPVNIAIADRRTANKLIEEFMLLTNEVVAEQYFFDKMPFVYRVHEKPDEDKINEFNEFIGSFGLSIGNDLANIRPAVLNDLLKKIKDEPMESVITTVMLRSMKKAFYSTECLGHFGLALKYYSHFTSPIRRYPDLMIHRIIKEVLRGKVSDKRKAELKARAESAAEQSSKTEVVAVELEREYEKMKKAEFMSYHLGEVFDAVISGVTSFGLFAELENTVEGLISIDELTDDHYDYERENYRLIGKNTKRTYSIGDKVRVQVVKAEASSREIDFIFAE